MFEGIKSAFRRFIGMFNYLTIKNIIGSDVALSQSMIDKINEWKNMMLGQAGWTSDSIKSLGIEHGICREFADIVLVEMETSVDDEILNELYQDAIPMLNENLQEGLGIGSFCLKPLPSGATEFITADKFIPKLFDDAGRPVDLSFLTRKRVGDNEYYTRVERHYFTEGNLTIENKCYYSQSSSDIGQPCSLTRVDEWAEINPGPVIYPGMNQMDFGYYRNPIKNNVDGTPCGVSIFESAVELIRKADLQGARLDWEYESGERAIHVDDRALKKDANGVRMGRLSKRLYRGLNIDAGQGELLKEYSPTMRDEAFKRGLEEYKREIEFNVGLAYGDLSNVSEVEKTATEVKTAKLRKYNRVTAIQKNLKKCLEDYVSALAFYQGKYSTNYEFNCVFNDSILTDEETEREQDRIDLSIGAMGIVEYRMKWYGETEDEAKQKVIVDHEEPDQDEE